MAKCFKWLNALPLSRYNFKLNKSEFRDGIYLGYGWEPTKTPLTGACSAKNAFNSLNRQKRFQLAKWKAGIENIVHTCPSL